MPSATFGPALSRVPGPISASASADDHDGWAGHHRGQMASVASPTCPTEEDLQRRHKDRLTDRDLATKTFSHTGHNG